MTRPPTDPADAFAELGRIKLGDVGLDDVLQRVAELAKRVLPTPVEVSVTLVRDGTGYTAAFTHDLALEMDERQYAQESGPCLDASATGGVLSVPDIAAEDRWPDWAERGREAGVGSSVSIGLPIQEAVVGALNVYARTPHSFDEDSVSVLETFAAYAAVALANAQLYDSTATLARQMQEAMASRAVIEQAKGIIMAERRCTPAEAFAILAKVSPGPNRKVRDVAQALVDRTVGASGA
ncbi:GAF and ANTAR domain-containing protein [Micromonospora sp. 4G57]|uniref:GAF and ANTAR domain-containing protein n=1 Tax=Micromonospora sicca TaxID=2202420 RepID=A0ABU5JB38_9ACTN|nr:MULTISPECIES: GAF and ANTAR domain-containing protein [unclassified Micromonospora]MDZ5444370.1 GAF and ANTAR domain-containing protein [Micromonospora sp. 4G57]MDZ5489796.1 GAF and ANTAR domain-containing protein [Micromonospora sp. 4G53]